MEFFVGVPEESLRSGPDRSLDAFTWGNFDAWNALLIWEAHFTGVSHDTLLDEGLPESLDEDDGGAVVFLFSEALAAGLAAASEADLAGLGERWAGEADEPLDAEIAGQILGEVAAVARRERRPGERVCCWVG